MEKFRGEFGELETLVSGLGYKGQWEDDSGKKVFRSDDNAILNWWPKTGTLQTQGPASSRTKLEEAVTKALSSEPPAPVVATSTAPAAIVESPPRQSLPPMFLKVHRKGFS